MTKIFRVALLLGGLLLSTEAAAAEKMGVLVSRRSAYLTFAEYSGRRLDLKPFSAADVIARARILFTADRGDVSYVVLELAGPTREHGGNGYCGAGEEVNLVWLKLSHATILDVRSVLVDSCAFSVDGGEIGPAKDGLHLDYFSAFENRKFVCSYDPGAPENGLTVTSMPAEE